MIISKIEIKNYRSCVDTKFDFHEKLSVIIGPNGTGKTNILNAILLLRKLLDEDSRYYHREDRPTARCSLKVWFKEENKTIILSTEINIYTDESNYDVVYSSKPRWYLKDYTGNAKRVNLPLCFMRHVAYHDMHPSKMSPYMRRELYYFQRQRNIVFPDVSARKPLNSIFHFLWGMRYYSALFVAKQF